MAFEVVENYWKHFYELYVDYC